MLFPGSFNGVQPLLGPEGSYRPSSARGLWPLLSPERASPAKQSPGGRAKRHVCSRQEGRKNRTDNLGQGINVCPGTSQTDARTLPTELANTWRPERDGARLRRCRLSFLASTLQRVARIAPRRRGRNPPQRAAQNPKQRPPICSRSSCPRRPSWPIPHARPLISCRPRSGSTPSPRRATRTAMEIKATSTRCRVRTKRRSGFRSTPSRPRGRSEPRRRVVRNSFGFRTSRTPNERGGNKRGSSVRG